MTNVQPQEHLYLFLIVTTRCSVYVNTFQIANCFPASLMLLNLTIQIALLRMQLTYVVG